MIVTLDAGHYGSKYNQSPLVKNYYESVFNWKMANYMKEYFEKYNIQVRLTRESINHDIGLYDRGYMAKGSDIFISIHSNACDSASVDYPVVIHGFDENSTSSLALSLARLIGETIGTRQEGRTYTRKKTNSYDEYYGVLRGARAAKVKYRYIIEHSFHTNKAAAQFLLKEENIRKLAFEESELIAQYFGYKLFGDSIHKKKHIARIIVENLNVRKVPDWSAKPCQVVHYGDAFTIDKEVSAKNGNTKMFKLKSGLYITTSKRYVETFYQ